MKTKITLKSFLTTAVIAVMLLFGFHAKAQTYVYNETTSSGIYFWPVNGSQVTNPVSDAVNSSANCAVSSTDGNWSQIQLFPNPKYTPVSGDKLYFSVHNPNGAGPGQIQFRYTSNPASWQFGANVTYVSGSVTGWVEYSVDLTSHVGNEIDQVILMPAGNSASAVYVDNIYFGQTSVQVTQNPIVYNETTNSGMWFQGTTGGEVANPLSGDAVNSSANVAKSATDAAWQQIQYFPTYTPVSGEKLFFSVYDPSNAGKAQIKFEYTGSSAWVDGGDVTYVSGTNTGWKEQSINLTPNAGNEISKIIIMPGYDTSSAVYIDNIYFGTTTTLSTNSVTQVNNRVYITKEGRIQFMKEQNNTLLSVYDLLGRLILQEKINGKNGEKVLNHKDIYILRVQSDKGVSTQKIGF